MSNFNFKSKTFRLTAIITAAILALVGLVCLIVANSALSKPEVSSGIRGEQFGIDKNINESTIDKYLGRSDSVYRDMRMLIDPGNYAAIDGDSYLSGFVEGFEVVPFPYIVNVTNLPAEVGATYSGKTLFTVDSAGNYTANYAESMTILEDLFPKDKNIFLMCGGGGYAGMMKQLLIFLGWDADKIYNVGGYWFYEGKHNVPVKTESGEYAFWKVPYHDIDFGLLHEEKTFYSSGNLIPLGIDELKQMVKDKQSFAVFVSQPECQTAETLRGVIKDWLKNNPRPVYEIAFSALRESGVANKVRFYPSFIIFREGKLVDFLDADDDSDKDAFTSLSGFENWLKPFLHFWS